MFSNRSEFEGYCNETRHRDSAVLLRTVSNTQVEDKVIAFFDLPQEPAEELKYQIHSH
ncbi:MAG: hypothetical protein ICV56_10605 [Nitrososphaeraceae archaeon]|nr:hypothetical protein [Nitrososphaeraceae archaeon]